MDTISNAIGEQVINDIISESGIPEFEAILSQDISVALDNYGVTLGSWGGSFYYWNLEIEIDNQTRTIGEHILADRVETEKFIASNAAALANTFESEWGGSISQAEFATMIGFGWASNLPITIKAEILDRVFESSSSGNYGGNPNYVSTLISDHYGVPAANGWLYNGTNWYTIGDGGVPVNASVGQAAILNDIRDIRLDHQSVDFDIDTFDSLGSSSSTSINYGASVPGSPTDYFSISNAVGDAEEFLGSTLNSDYLDGLLRHGGNYGITMPGSVLNGDGIFNVSRSGMLSDWWRPGAGELSTYDFVGFMGGAGSSVWGNVRDNFFDSNLQFDTSQFSILSGFNSYQADSFSFLNIDPLVLDLDGDGIELSSYQNANVLFNMDGDDALEQTGWIGADDAFLVHDKNGDGIINGVSEIFSEYYVPGAANGLSALATLDSNSDGSFTSADDAYAHVRVWKDADGDGQTDAGELTTLAANSITAIALAQTPGNGEIIEGNEILARSTMTKSGNTRQVAAVNLLANPAGHEWQIESDGVIINSQGGVSSFNVSDQNGATVNVATEGVDSAYGNVGDDTLIGDSNSNWLGGGAGSDTLTGGAGDDVLLIDSEDAQANIDGGDGFDIVQVVGAGAVNLNLSAANVELATGGAGDDILVGGGESSVFIGGGDGNDIIIGSGANDALSGEDGDDVVDGGYGDDVIRGHRGEDLLLGGEGNDIIDGGEGDDVINGGDGDDVIIGGGGEDTVDGGEGDDIVELSGRFHEYTHTVLGDGSIEMVDSVANRDGTITLKNVEYFNFRGSNLVSVATDSENPLPANDAVSVGASGPYTILASTLLSNDQDYQDDTLTITWVGDAVGGSVSLNGSGNPVFTPTAGYAGVMSFKYKVEDSEDNPGLEVTPIGETETAEMKATVTLLPANLPTDPLFKDQWYLSDANVVPVWNDYAGNGVKVGVFESDILDYEHPDLVPNLAAEHPNSIYVPGDIGTHATLVAGVIGAARNGEGGVGVAYGSELSSQKLGNNMEGVENAILYDVVNNSYGFNPAFVNNFATLPQNQDVVKTPVTHGRDGLGTIMVFGAGNDREDGGDATGSDLNASRFGIEVGAINKQADLASLEVAQTPFSNPGASILISAPGSSMTSTSRLFENTNGTNFGGDYETAQGTSFATPVVSGVAALMLEANPNLGYRDVQKILAYSARSIDDPETTWQTNDAKDWNGGMHFSRDYGFGQVDALAAVRLAETWNTQQTAANEVSSVKQSGVLNNAITDGTGNLTKSLTVTDNLQVEHVEVVLNLSHATLGDLVVTLIAPDGTQSILLNRLQKDPGSSDVADRGYGAISDPIMLNSTNFWGEGSAGTWQLKIEDKATGQTGTLVSWELRLYGEGASTNNTYIYTNEFATASGASRETLTDTAGIDTINAAAVTTASTIDLTAGNASTIAGRSLTINASSAIENAYGGDGNDTLTGNGSDNILNGGRGNDMISAGNGSDTLEGGAGNDTLTGGAGADTFVIRKQNNAADIIADFNIVTAGETIALMGFNTTVDFATVTISQVGSDTLITLEDGQTITLTNVTAANLLASHFSKGPELIGTDSANTITGTSGKDKIYGFGGNDTIDGGADDDSIDGGDGNDTLTGSAGIDIIRGKAGEDTISGGDGNDIVYGGDQDDTIHGNNNDDQLIGNLGDDEVYGDDGNDTLYGSDGNDALYGGNGNDTMYGGIASTDLDTTDNNDLMYGGAGNDTMHGTGGADTMYGEAGVDNIYAGSGDDTVDGGDDNDDILGGQGSDVIYGGAGSDRLIGDDSLLDTDTKGAGDIMFGGSGIDALKGGAGNDILHGEADPDDLYGGVGDDILHPGSGNGNYMWGGEGSDRFVIDPRYNANLDIIFDFDATDQNERIDLSAFGITGSDWGSRIWAVDGIQFSIPDGLGGTTNYNAMALLIRNAPGTLSNPINLNDTNFQKIYLVNVTSSQLDTDSIVFVSHNGPYWGTASGETINASDDNDTVYGLDGSDTLNGGSGKDQIHGGAGNDDLKSGAGADSLDGGAGIDTANYAASTSAVSVNLDANVHSGGEAEGDSLVSVENVTGSDYNDTIVGDGADNTLSGGAGSDTLNGDATATLTGGSEVQVNTLTSDFQGIPEAAALTGGGYVVAYSNRGYGTDWDVSIQRFDASGNKVGSETKVNTNTSGTQYDAEVAGLDNGGFVVGWRSYGQDGSDYGVYIQRFDSSGAKVGSETQVNTTTSGAQTINDIATLADGSFLVTWESNGQDGSGDGVYARRYAEDGTALTGEFRINTTTSGNQAWAEILPLSDGGYKVFWSSEQDGSGFGVYGQRFDSGNTKVGGEFLANTYTTSDQFLSNITMLTNGNYVVTWTSDSQDGGGYGIYAQIFDASDAKIGGEFRVNTTTTYNQQVSVLTGLDDGGFLVAWEQSEGGTSNHDLYAQRFDANGNKVGAEFRINDTTSSNQTNLHVTRLLNGDVVFNWNSNGQDGSDHASIAKQYAWQQGVTFGDDTLEGGAGSDTLNGGRGTDTARYAASASGVTVNLATNSHSGGDAAGDSLINIENVTGSGYNDTLTGNGSDNVLTGGAGTDTLSGGAGNDTLEGGAGGDSLDGGDGVDTVSYANASSRVYVNLFYSDTDLDEATGDTIANFENIQGSAYNDDLRGSTAANVINGGVGNDYIAGDGGNDTLNGEDGHDVVFAGSGNDTVHGNAGDDDIIGEDGTDTIYGDDGTDDVWAGTGDDTVYGGAGNDGLSGNEDNDTIYGDDGNDNVWGGSGNDIIDGGAGNDALVGEDGTDTIYGGDGNDSIWSGIGGDSMYGGAGNDYIEGYTGTDSIYGGTGVDELRGGSGADTFFFGSASDSGIGSGNRDVIVDFNSAAGDKIDLSALAGTFTFRGTSGFTGTANEINYAQSGGNTIIGVDANGDATLDFSIELIGLHTLAGSDFVL